MMEVRVQVYMRFGVPLAEIISTLNGWESVVQVDDDKNYLTVSVV